MPTLILTVTPSDIQQGQPHNYLFHPFALAARRAGYEAAVGSDFLRLEGRLVPFTPTMRRFDRRFHAGWRLFAPKPFTETLTF